MKGDIDIDVDMGTDSEYGWFSQLWVDQRQKQGEPWKLGTVWMFFLPPPFLSSFLGLPRA